MRHVAECKGRRTNGAAQAGFLLVDVLATITISAFLLAALFSLVSLVIHASKRVEDRAETIESRSRILASLSREVARIAPIRWPGKDAGFIFLGTPNRLAFASQASSANTAVLMQAVLLDATYAGLTRRSAAVSPVARSFGDLEIGPAETVFGRQYSIAFAYYRRLDRGREALLDSWIAPDQMPSAVRITLRDAGGAETIMRIQLDIDAETGCAVPEKAPCSLRPANNSNDAPDPALDVGAGGG